MGSNPKVRLADNPGVYRMVELKNRLVVIPGRKKKLRDPVHHSGGRKITDRNRRGLIGRMA